MNEQLDQALKTLVEAAQASRDAFLLAEQKTGITQLGLALQALQEALKILKDSIREQPKP
jgi:hypothetical protein